jgi:hypothetical protein
VNATRSSNGAAADYKPKGDQSAKYAGLETYSVGDRNAKSALVCIYDIFDELRSLSPGRTRD